VSETRKFPRWAVLVLRLFWALARLLPSGFIRLAARVVFSKSRRRLDDALSDPAAMQERHLLDLVHANRDSDFGREHAFLSIDSFEAYRRLVPIRSYDGFEPYVQRIINGDSAVLTNEPVTFFARSSGTTGTAKYIPVTESYLDEMRASRRLWMYGISQVFPGLVQGHFLNMQAPGIEGHTAQGVPYGSITVAMSGGSDDAIASPMEGIPKAVYAVEDFETKYYVLLRAALDLPISLMGALNPSTLLLLCQRLTTWAEPLAQDLEKGTLSAPGSVPGSVLQAMGARLNKRPAVARRLRTSLAEHGRVLPLDVWPKLCGVLCWKGGSAPFYLERLRAYIGDLPVMDYGYAASEGAFNVVLDAGAGEGIVAVMGHVLEFVPEDAQGQADPPCFLAHELEIGQRYAVIVSAGNGFYRYDINDIVEVVDVWRGLPRIRFVHKGGNMISLTGEKVGEAHVVQAITEAQSQLSISVAGFLVSARLGDSPRYHLAVEFDPESDDELDDKRLQSLLQCFDKELAKANIEYAAKRDSKRLAAPCLHQVAGGSFEGLRQEKVKAGASEGQVKVPHLWREPEVLDGLNIERSLDMESS